jgi:hypothetical protein
VDFSFTEDQQTIRDAVLAHRSRFPDEVLDLPPSY